MKAPNFWYESGDTLVAKLLQPAAALYQVGSNLRRRSAAAYRASIPMLCIGNVVAGGAGKTPVALAVAARLQARGAKPVFVTRGYGGSEAGPLLVDPRRHSASEVGDEALLLARRAPVVIGRDRAAAVKFAEPHGTHILLDDGLQNPTLAPDHALLVIDGPTGLGNHKTLPAGPLREPLADALHRVSAVVVIGAASPDLLAAITRPIIRARLTPRLAGDFPRDENFVAFAGIGRPEKFFNTCRELGLKLMETVVFPDHHAFRDSDIEMLRQYAARNQARLLTTEKDWVRLPSAVQASALTVPVAIDFEDTVALDSILAQL